MNSLLVPKSEEAEPDQPPWEVVRWTKLRKISGHAFSEIGKRNFGRPVCIAISTSIALGTSKGIILVFDYNQNLKSIIGPGTKGAWERSWHASPLIVNLTSCRIWSCYFHHHSRRPFNSRRWACHWSHFYLGSSQTSKAISSHPSSRQEASPRSRRACHRCSHPALGLFRHEAYCSGLRR